MLLNKTLTSELADRVNTMLLGHPVIEQLRHDVSVSVHQAILATSSTARDLSEVLASVPKLVRDQVPKHASVSVHLNSTELRIVQEYAKERGVEIGTHRHFYSTERIKMPAGMAIPGDEGSSMKSPSKDNVANMEAWLTILRANNRLQNALERIAVAVSQIPFMCVELRTLDKLMDNCPMIRSAVPQTWITDPDSVKKPATEVMDPATAARLRAIVTGEEA